MTYFVSRGIWMSAEEREMEVMSPFCGSFCYQYNIINNDIEFPGWNLIVNKDIDEVRKIFSQFQKDHSCPYYIFGGTIKDVAKILAPLINNKAIPGSRYQYAVLLKDIKTGEIAWYESRYEFRPDNPAVWDQIRKVERQ